MSTLMQAPIVQNFRKEVDRLLDRFSEGDLQPMLGRCSADTGTECRVAFVTLHVAQ